MIQWMLAIWSLVPLPFLNVHQLKHLEADGSRIAEAWLGEFEHYFTSVWDECNCAVVWAFFYIVFLWYWNENWPFPVLWPLQKRQKIRTLKNELLWSVGARYATGNQWRNNSRKNKEMQPKQKQHPVVSVTGDGSKVWFCQEQYWIGTWNVRSMNQGKLERSYRRWQGWTSTF